MPSLSWEQRLDLAQSEAQVIATCREFVAMLTPDEIASLPDPCRPGKIVDSGDVTDYAFTLVRHHCDDEKGSARVVHRLAAFFAHASLRLARVLARTNDPESGSAAIA